MAAERAADVLDALFADAIEPCRKKFDPEAELARRRVLAQIRGNDAVVTVSLGRFTLVRCVGRGGMGTVFEARDTTTGAAVALKCLDDPSLEALSRLKREFRTLRDVSHPNLVAMYELHVERELPFFTMELVRGLPLSRILDGPAAVGPRFVATCVRQLADALSALHHRGIVHGDVKPSNVIVGRKGTPTLVDFGVARVLGEPRAAAASGTPAYMAPECVRGDPVTPASDWYSLGAVLGELLYHVRISRAAKDPERVRALRELCTRLLEPEPPRRAGAQAIREALGTRGSRPVTRPEQDSSFVGREPELAELRRAFESIDPRPIVCAVSGEAGMGKTALVERFLSTPELASALVLRGRCYEDEALPYKGLDDVVEGLAHHLASLSDAERTELPQVDTHELFQVFPVLRRAGVAATGDVPHVEPRLVVQRAFLALSELLRAVARRRRLVVFVDDLQWGDTDGGALLRHLLSSPASPAMLFIASFRKDGDGACIAALDVAPSPPLRISPGPLEARHCDHLVRERLGHGAPPALRDGLMRESGGSPLLLHALLASGTVPTCGPRSYAQVVTEIVATLHDTARELLLLIVFAGSPIALELLGRAAGSATAPQAWLPALRAQRLVRVLVRAGVPCLLPHHDRVREVLVETVPPRSRVAYHARLARAAETLGFDDPEFLFVQHFRAEQLSAAAPHAELAGDRARETMALVRARELFTKALECRAPDRPPRLVAKLADAVAAGGDLKTAAPLYLEAAASNPSDGWKLRLRAAEIYLQRGEAVEGMNLLAPAMREARIPVPTTLPRAVVMGAVALAQSHVARRFGAKAGAPEDLRAELSFRAGHIIAVHDPKGAAMLLWSASRALRRGSTAQRGRALGMLAYVHSLLGIGGKASQDAMLAQALELTRSEPMAHAAALSSKALVAFGRCECADSLSALDTVNRLAAEHRLDAQWILGQVHAVVASVCVLAGDFDRIRRFAEGVAEEATQMGNRTVLAQIQSSLAWATLAEGDPRGMQRYTSAMLDEWAAPRLTPLYGIAVWGECHRLLYVGEDRAAHAMMRREAPRFVRSGLARTQLWAISLASMWGTIELACSRQVGDAHYRAVERHVRALERQSLLCARAFAALLRGGLARRAGLEADAARYYREARLAFITLGMAGFAAVAGRREVQLAQEPSSDVDLGWFVTQSIGNPARFTAMHAP